METTTLDVRDELNKALEKLKAVHRHFLYKSPLTCQEREVFDLTYKAFMQTADATVAAAHLSRGGE